MKNENITNRLIEITGISSPYAPSSQKKADKLEKKMLSELEKLEKQSFALNDSNIEYLLGIGYRNFTSWYKRGNDRKEYLEKCISKLDKSIELNHENYDSKIELSRILIEEGIVRNLDRALKISAELINNKKLPSWMDSIVAKAKRWTGDVKISSNNEFTSLDPTPAVLREERISLRKMLSNALKDGKDEDARIIASRLYNLGILVTTLYGDHDCNSGVMGMQYDEAINKMKENNEYNYEYQGRLKNSNFLSKTDYTKIEKVFGKIDNEIEISELKK